MSDRYNIHFLRDKLEKLLIKKGMPTKDAEVFIDSMISSDMCGVSTHGIRMIPSYLQRIDIGEFDFDSPVVLKRLPAFTVIDAKNIIGSVSAVYSVEIAVKEAKIGGIHTVFSRNSNTFGSGFYYVEKIADAGMIGFACCNTPAAMPAMNGLEAMLGTNPLAFAMPTRSYGNITIDMATSVVAKSRFGVAKEKGEKLEQGWALDKCGNPTTDPDEGMQGFVLPMAGYKGYGIAMIIDIISGFLSGAGFLNGVKKFYSLKGECMNVGHMIAAFNPELIYDGDFLSDADAYVERIKNSKSREGKEIIIPGEDRKRRKKEAEQNGIELIPEVVEKLEKILGEKLLK